MTYMNPYEHLWLIRQVCKLCTLSQDTGSIVNTWTIPFAINKLSNSVSDTVDKLFSGSFRVLIAYDLYVWDIMLCNQYAEMTAYRTRADFHMSDYYTRECSFHIYRNMSMHRTVRYSARENAIITH